MVGRARLTCDIDERWNGPPPRCEPILCQNPPRIPHGRFTQTNNITIAGTVVEYSCESRRYKLVGAKRIVCLPIGQYDKPPPACKEDIRTPIGGVVKAPKPTSHRPKPGIVQATRPPHTPARPVPPSPVPDAEDYEDVKEQYEKASTIPEERPYHTVVPPPRTSDRNHVAAGHPQENEIPDSVNIRNDVQPNANIPSSVDEERRETAGARLNLGEHDSGSLRSELTSGAESR